MIAASVSSSLQVSTEVRLVLNTNPPFSTGLPGPFAVPESPPVLLFIRQTLGRADRSLVNELRDHRNEWAHQHSFSSDNAYRALDSAGIIKSSQTLAK